MTKVELESAFLIKEEMVKKTKKNQKKPKNSFFSILNISDNAQLDDEFQIEDMEDKIDNILNLGEKLKKRVSFENISNYKNSIKQLLSSVVKNNYFVSEVSSGQNIFVRKQYVLVDTIDEKLNDFVRIVLQNQINQIEILSKLEEIQGLLINLLQ